jgi:hypothetical protein
MYMYRYIPSPDFLSWSDACLVKCRSFDSYVLSKSYSFWSRITWYTTDVAAVGLVKRYKMSVCISWYIYKVFEKKICFVFTLFAKTHAYSTFYPRYPYIALLNIIAMRPRFFRPHPKDHSMINSPLTTQGMLRIDSYPDPHGPTEWNTARSNKIIVTTVEFAYWLQYLHFSCKFLVLFQLLICKSQSSLSWLIVLGFVSFDNVLSYMYIAAIKNLNLLVLIVS